MTFRLCSRKSNLCTFHRLSRFLFPFVKSRAILNSRSLATELIGALRSFEASLAISGNLLLLVVYASVTEYLLHNSALNRDKRRYNDDKINVPSKICKLS